MVWKFRNATEGVPYRNTAGAWAMRCSWLKVEVAGLARELAEVIFDDRLA